MIKQQTQRTAHLLVTCCIEKTRFDVLKEVTAALKSEQETKDIDITPNLWVIDNASTYEGSREFIKENYTRVFQAEQNYGFWSVINWFLHYLRENHPGQFDYLHIIESDHVFFALDKLLTCEQALMKYPHIGSIRCQEFIASLAHLYDKDRQSAASRSYAWVRQVDWDGTRITFNLADKEMDLYESRLVPLLHSVNRLDAMYHAFEKLEKHEKLSEQDFQRYYREKYGLSGFIDGGLFHTKLSWQTDALSASWSPVDRRDSVGYRDTRHDRIVPLGEMKVSAT